MPDEFILNNMIVGCIFYWRTDKGYFYKETKGVKSRVSVNEYVSAYEESLELPFCDFEN